MSQIVSFTIVMYVVYALGGFVTVAVAMWDYYRKEGRSLFSKGAIDGLLIAALTAWGWPFAAILFFRMWKREKPSP